MLRWRTASGSALDDEEVAWLLLRGALGAEEWLLTVLLLFPADDDPTTPPEDDDATAPLLLDDDELLVSAGCGHAVDSNAAPTATRTAPILRTMANPQEGSCR